MPLQQVQVIELDGQLGVLPSGQRALAIVGPADAGPLNTPSAFARTQDITAAFTGGAAVEDACWHIQTKGLPVLFVRCAASTVSTFDAIDVTGKTGSSAVTINVGSLSDDDYETYVLFVTGGSQGVAGITYQTSLDGGRTLGPVTALGTAVNFTIAAGTSTIQYNLGTGSIVAGDVVKCRFHGPAPSAGDLTTALNALKLSVIDWEICYVVGALTTTSAASVTTFFAGQPERAWCGSVDVPTSAQTEATYLSTLAAAWIAVADSFCVGLCAGAARVTSAVSGRSYAKRIAVLYASLLASVQEHIDVSQLKFTLPGTFIADVNGNPVTGGVLLHDERLFPGLDDARFVTLRSYDGRAGARFTNPNTLASVGSDFQYAQHRRVMMKLKRTLRLYLEQRLSVEIRVNASTGFILEVEAQDIEAGADAICASTLAGQVSAGGFKSGIGFLSVSRTDNLLSTKTINCQGAAVPLAYPKAIILDVGFKNPALRVQPVPGT